MILLEHSAVDARTIGDRLGEPDYSYWFVRKAFRPMLEQFGVVAAVTDPAEEVARVARTARAHGQDAAFFSFTPPQSVVLGEGCPTVPVFAWEFDTIPDEVWDDDPRNDWRNVLSRSAAAITHSRASVKAVRRTMGADYPIWSIPAPIYERTASLLPTAMGWRDGAELSLGAVVVDTQEVELGRFGMLRAQSDGVRALRLVERRWVDLGRPARRLALRGVVYTSVFNPVDGRKNWNDLLSAFVFAFRDEPDATLVLKVTHHDLIEGMLPVLSEIAKLGAFSCRVVAVHGMLPEGDYRALIEASSFGVNTSNGEGQCLPLMEFMSAGRPALAPLHTAMLDYVAPENAFVLKTTEKLASWPQDPRQAKRCVHHVLNFAHLVSVYRESFRVARDEPGRYAEMAAAASGAQARFCSEAVVHGRLAEVFAHLGLPSRAAPSRPGALPASPGLQRAG